MQMAADRRQLIGVYAAVFMLSACFQLNKRRSVSSGHVLYSLTSCIVNFFWLSELCEAKNQETLLLTRVDHWLINDIEHC